MKYRIPSSKSARPWLWILLAILALNCFLNFFGIRWGLPESWYPDETEVIEQIVIPMARNVDLNPHIFDKTTLYYYVLLVVLAPYFLFIKLTGASIEPYRQFVSHVLLISRCVTACIGVVGIILMYHIGKTLRDRWTGIAAAFLLAINVGYVSYAHFAYMDIPMMVLLLSCLLFAFRYLDSLRMKDLVLASLFGGLAVSAKYNAGLFVVFLFLVCHIVRVTRRPKGGRKPSSALGTFFSKAFFLSLGVVILGFVAGTPYSVLDYKAFLTAIIKELFISKGYKVFDESFLWIKNFFILRDGFGTPMYAFALAAFLYGWIRFVRAPSAKGVVLFLMPLLYYLYLGSWHITAFRYLLPLTPFLILSVALMAADLRRRAKPRLRIPFFIVAAGLSLFSVGFALSCVGQFNQDTRQDATDWLESNLERSTLVETYGYRSYLPAFPERVSVQRLTPNFVVVSKRFEAFKKGEMGKRILTIDKKRQYENALSAAPSNADAFTLDALQKRN
ncbi:MAG TPA: glycosyltransferase family 39 protein, partial [bacterium]